MAYGGGATLRRLNAAATKRMRAFRLVMNALTILAVAVASASGKVVASPTAVCPVPGKSIHWLADYCMASMGTDDEIAASGCIAAELRLAFGSECIAKLHYKRAMCALALRNGIRSDDVDACVADPQFIGSTVRNGGIGN